MKLQNDEEERQRKAIEDAKTEETRRKKIQDEKDKISKLEEMVLQKLTTKTNSDTAGQQIIPIPSPVPPKREKKSSSEADKSNELEKQIGEKVSQSKEHE